MQDTFKVPHLRYQLECLKPDGGVRWTEDIRNLVTYQGIDNLLNSYFKGVNYTAQFYVGLIASGGEVAKSDTSANHPGWEEFVDYTGAGRPALTLGPTQAQLIDNTTSRSTFELNANGVVSGAFLSTSSAKGGTGGTLYSEALFTSGDKAMLAGDVLAVTVIVAGE